MEKGNIKKRFLVTILLILIFYVVLNGFIAIAKENIVSVLNIDTVLKDVTFSGKNLHIEGWKLANEKDTKIKIYIDDEQIEEKYTKYSRKYDLISIVRGYGTYEENPTPNFDVDIPISILKQGTHKLKIEFVTSNNEVLKKVENNIIIDKGIKSHLNIDTQLNNVTFNKKQIDIEGWKLATVANTKIEVYIDNGKLDEKYIKYSYKYALTSIVKGYGESKENPTPNFDIIIPTDDIKQGIHTLKIRLVTSENEILANTEYTINVDKNIKSILNIDTILENQTFYKKGIHIEGWKLAVVKNTKLNVYIDNKKISEEYINYSHKYDLISIVKGYGTYEENPTPNFDIDIPANVVAQGSHRLKIEFVTDTGDVLKTVENQIYMEKSTKSILNIDTNLSNARFDSDGINIQGWKLSTEVNTTLNVYIDNNKVENKYIKYSYKYDLISLVKGYGTYEENPTPNFDINIPTSNITVGSHKLKIEFVSSSGTVFEKVENTIYIDKVFFEIHIESIFDRNTITNEVHPLSGWVMTNSKAQKLRLMLDGVYQDNTFTRTKRPDVINYFNNAYESKNPTPGFSTNIDFSKLSIGMHQIALRVFDENDNKVGEVVIYVFLKKVIPFEQGTYGKSAYAQIGDSRGSNLTYYKYGDGPNVFFATFSVHGFEDNWDHDGAELTYIANEFYNKLKSEHKEDYDLANNWTIYILPKVNPDGQQYGYTNNGPGRTTMYSDAPGHKGIDLNRCWKYSGFNASETSRNYAGTASFQSVEARYLRDFLTSHKSVNGQTILVDLHGWLQQLIGNRQVAMYYAVQFPEAHGRSLDKYGDGYLINWARTALASNGRTAKTALIELPDGSYSHQSVVSRNFAGKYIQATLSMLHGILE